MVRSIVKKLIPFQLIQYYRQYKYSSNKHLSRFYEKPLTDTFTQIYHENYWKGEESISGKGSEKAQTEAIREKLPQLLNRYSIHSILDIPCGDFNWMKLIPISGINYTGADIVKELIALNRKLYAEPYINFEVMNITSTPLPESDLILCRDCFVHLSFKHIYQALANIISSKSTYLLTTSFAHTKLNFDITSGDWRTLNLQKSPFNFPSPIEIIAEHCSLDNGEFDDKALMLWKIDSLKLPPVPYHLV
jgi:SAM-dependent methyltransferase